MQVTQSTKAQAFAATLAHINAHNLAAETFVFDPVAARIARDARMSKYGTQAVSPIFTVKPQVVRLAPPMPDAQVVSDTLESFKKLADYEARLKRFDWHFEFSEDGSVRRSAKADLEILYTLQSEIDPDGEFWNLYKPDSMGVPMARKVAV
jgi:hypothetical protein